MKQEGGYRFSLQFPGDTEAQVRVGETLKRLGRKKSSFIIRAVISYLDNHPEEETPPSLHSEMAVLTRNEIKNLILSVINDMHLNAAIQPEKQQDVPVVEENPVDYAARSDAQQADIDAMLKNLDIFS